MSIGWHMEGAFPLLLGKKSEKGLRPLLQYLPAAIAKVGIVFNVSVCMCQHTKQWFWRHVCGLDHNIASISARVRMFVLLSQQNLVSAVGDMASRLV